MNRVITAAVFLLVMGMFCVHDAAGGKPVEPAGMVKIPAGPFIMGSNDGPNDAKPQRKITLKAYYMDKYEVTNADYKKYLDAMKAKRDAGEVAPLRPPNCQVREMAGAQDIWDKKQLTFPEKYGNHPVTCVSQVMASLYCEWAGKRLPTEAEWEKAARGPDGLAYPWGNEWDPSFTNHGLGKEPWEDASDGFATAAPVGSFPKDVSPYGVFDMAGNVWEWTADIYSPGYYKRGPLKDPTGPTEATLPTSETPKRAGFLPYSIRGGAWPLSGDFMKSYFRNGRYQTFRDNSGGFRCAK